MIRAQLPNQFGKLIRQLSREAKRQSEAHARQTPRHTVGHPWRSPASLWPDMFEDY